MFLVPIVMFINDGSVYGSTVEFSDINELDSIEKEKVTELSSRDIILGYSDGKFKPYGKVTRGEFSALISRSFNLEDSDELVPFSDVTKKTSSYEGIKKS